jgi:DUF2946 family protein
VNAFRFPRRAAAWIALASMALNAAWPLLADAKPAVPASPSEICTAAGLDRAPGGGPGDSPGKTVHASHCSLCPFHAERGLAIAGLEQPLIPPAAPAAAVPSRESAPPPESALHPAAPARAPPFPS